MSENSERVTVAAKAVIALQGKGASKIDAVDAVAYKSQLTDTETAAVVRAVNRSGGGQ